MTHVQTAQIRFGQQHSAAEGPWGGVPDPKTNSEQQYHWLKRYVASDIWDEAHPLVDIVDFRVWIDTAGVVMERLLRL